MISVLTCCVCFHPVLLFFLMHLWLCGQVSTRWGFREEIVLGAGRKAESCFNGFLLQNTSKISQAFFFTLSLLSFVDQYKPDSWFGFDFKMRILLKVVWKLKLPEALILLVPLWASEASLLALTPFEPMLEHAGSTAWNSVEHNESVAFGQSHKQRRPFGK